MVVAEALAGFAIINQPENGSNLQSTHGKDITIGYIDQSLKAKNKHKPAQQEGWCVVV